MSNLNTAITVSFLALGVIFLTLTILIGVIKVLVSWMPYTAPPSHATQAPTGDAETGEHIAIIHTALAHYLDKRPEEIQIANIRPL